MALVTGIVQALGTPWGLMRQYWVTISLALTTFAFVILVLHLPAVAAMAAVAADPTSDVDQVGGDLFHAVGGLVVLLVPLALNIYKPRGMTRYGWRRTHDRRASSPRTLTCTVRILTAMSEVSDGPHHRAVLHRTVSIPLPLGSP